MMVNHMVDGEVQHLPHVQFFQEEMGEKVPCVDVQELGGVFAVQLVGYCMFDVLIGYCRLQSFDGVLRI